MGGSSTYTVEREKRIDAPGADVIDRLVDFHRWEDWSPWADIDPEMSQDYSGPESGVGATHEWEGNRKAGKGRMEITEVEGAHKVTIDLQFLKPFKSRTTTTFSLRPDGDATVITWTMTGPKTVMTRIMGIFTSMDKMIGKDFERGLDRLKADVESR